MARLKLFEYYKKMCDHHIVLDFQGALSHDMLVVMAETIKKKFIREHGKTRLVNKIFSIFIEMVQNISAYSAERVRLDERNPDVGTGIIVVSEIDKVYSITSGNLIAKDRVGSVIEHCKTINRMNPGELKSFYKERIKSPRPKGHKGAGLGLISIARKAGGDIFFKTAPVDEQRDFLVLSVKVGKPADKANKVKGSEEKTNEDKRSEDKPYGEKVDVETAGPEKALNSGNRK